VSTVRESVRDAVDLDAFAVEFDRTTTTVLAMLGTDALLWVLLVDGHVPMPGMGWLMDQGVPMAAPGAMLHGAFHAGTPGAILGYAAIWGVMMWAMMHPAMTPFARDFADAHRGTTVQVAVALSAFMLAYHAVWTASAVLPLAANALLPGGVYGVVRAHTHLAVGGALTLTGLYQLSRFKRSRLRDCCSAVDPHESDVPTALRDGLVHGTQCVLVCFGPFFLLMPVFGSMNLLWMVALTAVVAAERLPPWGREVAVAVGVVSLLAGLAVLLGRPDLPLVFEAAAGA
jgi:predicted metal-binding membrane protein